MRERERKRKTAEPAAEQHEHRNSCDIYDNKTHIAHTGGNTRCLPFILLFFGFILARKGGLEDLITHHIAI
jgi:hypothetical protein